MRLFIIKGLIVVILAGTTNPVYCDETTMGKDKACSNPSPNARDKGLSLLSFANHPLFAAKGPSKDDVFQGGGGDCYFLSTLAALADADPDFIRRAVVHLTDGTFSVRFFQENGAQTFVHVTADLWVDNSGNLRYARLGQQGALWVPILEKAYAVCRRNKNSYDSIAGGGGKTLNNLVWKYDHIIIDETGVNPEDVVNWFNRGATDGDMKNTINERVRAFLNKVDAQRRAGKGLVMGGPAGFSNRTPLVYSSTGRAHGTYRRGQHIYMIDHVETDGGGNYTGIVLRDPGGAYRRITDFVRIFFCTGSAATVEPQG